MTGGLTPDLLPSNPPAGLDIETRPTVCWRIDAAEPADWDWGPFPAPRYRFDSATGTARVRYAGLSQRGAARERWNPDRSISAADATSWLIQLSGNLRVVDLRSERTLDALGLDDRINTARDADTWATCQELGDRLRDWYGADLDGILYRSRTTPQTSANLAWHTPTALQVVTTTRLRNARALLDSLVLGDGFTVRFDW